MSNIISGFWLVVSFWCLCNCKHVGNIHSKWLCQAKRESWKILGQGSAIGKRNVTIQFPLSYPKYMSSDQHMAMSGHNLPVHTLCTLTWNSQVHVKWWRHVKVRGHLHCTCDITDKWSTCEVLTICQTDGTDTVFKFKVTQDMVETLKQCLYWSLRHEDLPGLGTCMPGPDTKQNFPTKCNKHMQSSTELTWFLNSPDSKWIKLIFPGENWLSQPSCVLQQC